MKRALFILFILIHAGIARAQKVEFFGLGRAVISREKLAGKITEGDTANPRQGLGGYTLLDMGVKYHPYHHFRTHAILRIKNQFGMFWGEGTTVTAREVRIEGVASKIIHFEVGDLDMKFSPFTLYVPDLYPEKLPEIFKIRRTIQEYEAFVTYNQRRLQGLSFFNSLISRDGKSKLRSRVLLARTVASEVGGESRMLAGGNVKYSRREAIQLQLNALSNFQLKSTRPEVTHHVVSLDYVFLRPISKNIKLRWTGETAASSQEVVLKNNGSNQVSGHAFLIHMQWQYKSFLEITPGYLSVSPAFYSPGAQTALYNYYQPPSSFPVYGNVPVLRKTLVHDHLTQEDIIDRAVRNHLFPYFPNYNNIFPYGQATPNRSCYKLNLSVKNVQESIHAQVEGLAGRETEPEKSNQPRKFQQLSASVTLDVQKWLGWNKQLRTDFTFRNQHTTRNSTPDSTRIQLSTTFISGGLSAELAPDFFFLTGLVMNAAYGNEQMPLRTVTNEIYEIRKEVWNEKQWMFSTGLQYKFGSASFLTLHINSTRLHEGIPMEEFLSLQQAYLNFTLGF